MNNITIVLPIRIENEDRLENVKTVLLWLDKMDVPIILLEADKTPYLKGIIAKYKHVTYHFVKDPNDVFHRTKYINMLLLMSSTDMVAVWDADIILPKLQLKHAVELMIEHHATIVYPYNGKILMLSQKQSKTFRKTNNLFSLQSMSINPLMGRTACGGVYIVNRKKYPLLGGDNEKFIGWGPEDAERLHRIQIAGEIALWLNTGVIYHLYHQRTEHEGANFYANLLTMRKEFVKVCSLNREEMLAYIQNELVPTQIRNHEQHI